jgi:hypothetical protein
MTLLRDIVWIAPNALRFSNGLAAIFLAAQVLAFRS